MTYRAKQRDIRNRRTIKESKGAITFRDSSQEEGGKVVWCVFIYPFRKPRHKIIVTGRPPEDATIVNNLGNARKTAQLIYNKTIARVLYIDKNPIIK